MSIRHQQALDQPDGDGELPTWAKVGEQASRALECLKSAADGARTGSNPDLGQEVIE